MSPVVFLQYVGWHYSRGISDMIRLWGTAIWFPVYWCALGFHTRHFFSRFNRLGEAYPGQGFHLGELLGSFFVNIIMRILGAIFRLAVILLGLILSFTAAVIGSVGLVIWILLPFVVVFVIILGVTSMFSL